MIYRRTGEQVGGPRTAWAALLASTMLAGVAPAVAAPAAAPAETNGATSLSEVIVTAEKREENLQHAPMSIQAIDTKLLTQHNVTSFNDYSKLIPSLQYQSFGPDAAIIYMRGVADGGNGNHSGPQPSVATYLDELPITTIGGTLDVHIFDIARIEALPGPQGTLYGSSSESGTLRIITNQPSTSGLSGALEAQGDWVDHGDEGYLVQGFVNVPVNDRLAVRLVAFDQHDAGYIDNAPGQRAFVEGAGGVVDGIIDNAKFVKSNFNSVDTFGGRLAAKFDLNDDWSIEPQVVAQDQRIRGIFGYNPEVGYLQVNRFQPDSDHDRWYQAGLTIRGKLGRYDITYAGGYFARWIDSLSDYTDYSVAYDQCCGYGSYWVDQAGAALANPAQEIVGRDRFEKGSNELRIASPATDRLRFIAGLFQERQTHWIIQDYQIQGLAPDISVTGWPNTWWLTDQDRIDSDRAAFGEVSFDITPKLTILGGVRYYHYDNSLYGFYGFNDTSYSSTGEVKCALFPGQTFRDAPCVNLNKVTSGSGETHKVNLTYRIDDDKLVYFTYSTGYRPGGVNRNGNLGPYQADFLTNYEVGWKTSWLDHSLTWNGALYDEEWSNFQFAYLGQFSLTVVQNAPSARILGVESSIQWRPTQRLTLSAAGAYNDAELTADFCTDADGNVVSPCGPNPVLAPKGQQLPYTPKFNGNLTARYTLPLGGWDAHGQATLVYQSSRLPAVFTDDITNLGGRMPGFATVDFSFGAERGKTSMEVFINNAFDSHGQLNRYTPCTTSVCAPGYPGGVGSNGIAYPATPAAVYVVPTQPLTVGIRLAQKF
ncbi:MAG: TonB-dependent receptor [Caulobacteraceae bacterium]